mmetsp:Transcript_4102/g.10393  ORF Transcript_4102/g.10393 Transcript_4102/m.10393 type:complete len:204 (-) Transcript_4102:164-775(-)
MWKRQALPSCSDSEESGDPAAKRKKEGKKDKENDSKDKGKDKGKEKDKDKKDKDKDKKDKKEKKAERAVEGPTAPPGSSQDKAKKVKKNKKEDAGAPTKEVVFSGSEAFNKPTHPFGLELDGGLVVDLADKGGLALAAGVQIGWRVLSVDGKAVSEEEVGLAAELLRAAEEKMAKEGTKVVVRFVTEEPMHWKRASNKLAGRR